MVGGGGGGEHRHNIGLSVRIQWLFITSAQSSANFYTANIKDVLRAQMDLI
jgi:hypothetical protein